MKKLLRTTCLVVCVALTLGVLASLCMAIAIQSMFIFLISFWPTVAAGGLFLIWDITKPKEKEK